MIFFVQDLATQWIQSYRVKRKFLDSEENPKVVYTDASLEFGKASEDLQWNHCASTPHRAGDKGNCRKSSKKSPRGHFIFFDYSWDSMDSHGQSPWNVIAVFGMLKDLLSDGVCQLGKPHMNGDLKNNSVANKTIWSESRISSDISKGSGAAPSVRKGSTPRHLCGLRSICGGSWKGNLLVADFEE